MGGKKMPKGYLVAEYTRKRSRRFQKIFTKRLYQS